MRYLFYLKNIRIYRAHFYHHHRTQQYSIQSFVFLLVEYGSNAKLIGFD